MRLRSISQSLIVASLILASCARPPLTLPHDLNDRRDLFRVHYEYDSMSHARGDTLTAVCTLENTSGRTMRLQPNFLYHVVRREDPPRLREVKEQLARKKVAARPGALGVRDSFRHGEYRIQIDDIVGNPAFGPPDWETLQPGESLVDTLQITKLGEDWWARPGKVVVAPKIELRTPAVERNVPHVYQVMWALDDSVTIELR